MMEVRGIADLYYRLRRRKEKMRKIEMSLNELRKKEDKEDHIVMIILGILIIVWNLVLVPGSNFVALCFFVGVIFFLHPAWFLIRDFLCENKNIGI